MHVMHTLGMSMCASILTYVIDTTTEKYVKFFFILYSVTVFFINLIHTKGNHEKRTNI